MASIDFINKRIAGKEKEIAKLEAKLQRIEKAEASGWEENNPYYYGPADKRYTLNDLDLARKSLADWQEQLRTAEEKAASRNVPAILQFLELWKKHCFDWYVEAIKAAYECRQRLNEIDQDMKRAGWGTPEYKDLEKSFKELQETRYNKLHGYFEEQEVIMYGRPWKKQVKVRDGEWEYALHYICSSYEEGVEKLRKDLDEEANRKYDFIIERTHAITGKITDAGGLKVGASGDLNGYIVGEKGTAKVKTIGAGGYNIQCFHFRTLIRRMA